jgi:RNA polymerase sigma-70 factor (ECF subfamily)
LLSPKDINNLVRACALNDRESQEKIYNNFYGYALAICESHANNHEDALEILNDGFLKIFRRIKDFKPAYADVVISLKGWIRRIMVHTAIDHFRKNRKHQAIIDLDSEVYQMVSVQEEAMDKLSTKEIINAVQHLSPATRAVFSLFIFEGLRHNEVAEKLGITVGASKSHLIKARKQLKMILLKQNNHSLEIRA